MGDHGGWSHRRGHLPKGQTLAEARKDKKVRADLLQCLLDDLLMQVAKKKKGKEVWDSLKARFVGVDRVKEVQLQTLKSEFDAMRMKEDEPLVFRLVWCSKEERMSLFRRAPARTDL